VLLSRNSTFAELDQEHAGEHDRGDRGQQTAASSRQPGRAADLELAVVCTTSPRIAAPIVLVELGAVCTTSPPIAAVVLAVRSCSPCS
jgi:hypothetical protein